MSTSDSLPSSHHGGSDALGLKLLAKGDKSGVDVVAIHGLNGHLKATWTAPNETFWLQDLLPKDIPSARIFSYGYDASISNAQVFSEQTILHQAEDLIKTLAHMRERSQTRRRSIIFVAHSYGGILLKAALIHSNALAGVLPEHHLIKLSTFGVIFLGTPHRGTARASLATITEDILKGLRPEATHLAAPLQQNLEWLQSQSSKYLLISKDFTTNCYYETRPVYRLQQLIVPQENAILSMALVSTKNATDTDHFHMGQFSTRTDKTYKELLRDIQLLTVKARDRAVETSTEEVTSPFGPGQKSAIFMMPYGRDPGFVGREEDLKQMGKTMPKLGKHARFALVGSGGIGKTSLAREYTYRLRAETPQVSVFWVHAWTKPDFEQSYREIANALELPGRDDPDIDVLHLVNVGLLRPELGRWFMVLDNVDDPSIVPILLTYLPQGGSGTIMFITRSPNSAVRLCGFNRVIQLGVMAGHARHLLATGWDREVEKKEDPKQKYLRVEMVHDLPLAIKQATYFVNYYGMTDWECVKRYRDASVDELAMKLADLNQDQQGIEARLLNSQPQHPSDKSWIFSFDQLRRQHGKAAELVSLLAMLSEQRIPKTLLEKGLHQEAEGFQKEWRTLQALNMIETEDDGRNFRLHWRVQHLVRLRLMREGALSTWQGKALLLLTEGFPKVSFQNRVLCAMCMTHVDAVLQYSDSTRSKSNLLVQTAMYFQQLGCYQVAEGRVREALAIEEAELGLEPIDTVKSIAMLGWLLNQQGKYDAARKTLSLAETKCMQIVGPDHPVALNLACHTTLVLVSLGDYEEAETTAWILSEKHIRLLGREHPSTLNSISILALALVSQGKLKGAEPMYGAVLKLRKSLLGDEHPDTLDTVSSLAFILGRQGKHKEAELTHRTVLEVRERVLGREHPSTLDSVSDLALVLKDQNEIEEAKTMYWRALAGREKVLGQEHPHTSALKVKLSALFSAKGRLTAAEATSQPVPPRPIQCSQASDSDVGCVLSVIPAPPGPRTTSDKPSVIALDSVTEGPDVVKVVIESLVQNEILTPLFVRTLESNWSGTELVPEFIRFLENYSDELRIEVGGALGKTVAAIINDEKMRILCHIYSSGGILHDAVVEQAVAPSAEVAMNIKEQRARRTWQQISAAARDYSMKSPDFAHVNQQFENQILEPLYEQRRDAYGSLFGEFEIPTSDDQVRELIISGKAFNTLRYSIHQLVLPDMMEAIRQEVTSNLNLSKTRHSVTFSVCWGARKYLSEEFEYGQAFGPILTLSGNAKSAYATSCAEYMSWNWPYTGSPMLKAVQTAVQVGTYYCEWSPKYRWPPEWTWPTELHAHVIPERPNTITVKVLGSTETLVDMAQQLGWLAASFRVSTMNELAYSEIDFRGVDYGHFQLDILGLQPLKEAEKMCWHPLFPNSIIARGFPIPERTCEIGLELSFEVMLSLARITHAVIHDDGIVLSGFSTLIFPTAQHPAQSQASRAQKPSTIQWHLLSSGNDHLRILSGEALAKHDDSWLKIGDAEVLRTARTFLGYCNAVCIHLGTKRSGYEGITHSPLPEDKPPAELSIHSGSVGTSGLGIFGGNLTMQVVLPKSLSSITKVDCYDDILSTAKIEPLLLYDAEKQQGWLVSMLSVILHMVHGWASERVPNVQIPHANLDWNGGQAAFDVIAEHSNLELRRSLEDDTPYYVKDLVKRLWYDLISCVDAMSLQTKRGRGSVRMGPPRLRGWEFRDILDPPVLRRMKEEKLDSSGCGWDLLAEDILVLVCQGLGEVIQPAEPGEVCRNWCPIPRGRRYLTASVACLQQLSKRRGMGQGCTKLTDTLLWQPPGDLLFQNCVHGVINQCSKLPQQLVVDGKLNPSSPTEVPKKGAVIFGKSTNKLRKERTESKNNTNPLKGLLILGGSH